MAILLFRKRLVSMQRPPLTEGVDIRLYAGHADAIGWLELHELCFAQIRRWEMKDFRREFLSKAWWSPQRMWIVESPTGECVGSVTLRIRTLRNPDRKKPSVNWLMVHPRWRRRGIARFLMWQLESQPLAEGESEVILETRSDWEAAVRFYGSVGYEQLTSRG